MFPFRSICPTLTNDPCDEGVASSPRFPLLAGVFACVDIDARADVGLFAFKLIFLVGDGSDLCVNVGESVFEIGLLPLGETPDFGMSGLGLFLIAFSSLFSLLGLCVSFVDEAAGGALTVLGDCDEDAASPLLGDLDGLLTCASSSFVNLVASTFAISPSTMSSQSASVLFLVLPSKPFMAASPVGSPTSVVAFSVAALAVDTSSAGYASYDDCIEDTPPSSD